ncbi:hypothetical protein NBH00_12965 [Paraconexibacter antarcticus]|uniref:Uncharacterized protein n=1 Tax=Paraconexibacter antarcticus TaxID=2949664 RepID=A0ABY5DN91_9ACTN|nr:hypothetical protein [Paraconexibacter antarcticus]UTI62277.1 hypothetical protein NBH00_12965 [Paraconexibacter antarcticus]
MTLRAGTECDGSALSLARGEAYGQRGRVYVQGEFAVRRKVQFFAVMAVVAAATVGGALVGIATGHSNSCHSDHSCPSDDHSYVWSGLSCTSDPAQRLPEDQTPIDYGGVHYYCHTVTDQGMTPTGTGTTSTTTATTPHTTTTHTTGSTPVGSTGGGVCGLAGGRATISDLGDAGARQVSRTVSSTTVSHLHELRAPAGLGAARTAAERRRYHVLGRITQARLSTDGTWTLTLSDPGDQATATAAFPAPGCLARAPNALRVAAARARRAVLQGCGLRRRRGTVHLRGQADITGIGYFRDRTSHLTLHPAVAFAGLNCRRR